MTLRRIWMAILLVSGCLAQDMARMDEVVQSYVSGKTFMGSVLVARGSEVLFRKGYGSANLELDVANSPSTKFRLGSISKQFTAASILLLEERGKLKVDDPVKKYLPDAPAAWDKVTIFHLLTHSSGIPDFTGFPEYAKLEPFAMTPEKIVAVFRDKPLDFEPGAKMSYSNSGYVLLGYLIEKVTGGTYQKFLQENIFAPLDMKDSGYDSNSAVIPHRASGYVATANGYENAGFVHMSIPFSAGALYSTVDDLLKWEQGLFGGRVVSAASLQKMTTPFKSRYGLGVFVATANGRKEVSHAGGIEGFNTFLAYYPEDKLTVAVLGNVNGNAPQEIAAKLANLTRGEKVTLTSERKEVTVSPKILAEYVGTYELQPAVHAYVRLEGDHLTTQLSGQPRFPLFAESETKFFLKVVDAQMEFLKDEKGTVTALVLHQGGRDQRAARTSGTVAERKEIKVAAAKLAEYPGVYQLRPELSLTVKVEGEQLMGQVTGQAPFAMFGEAEDRFFLKVVDAQVTFERNAQGAVTGLVLRQGPVELKGPRN